MAGDEESSKPGVVHPLYVKHADLELDMNTKITVYEFCKELMKTVKREDIEGAQRIGGLWRIYLNNHDARNMLFGLGMTFRDISVMVYEDNPFLSKPNANGTRGERPLKVFVQNIPLSVSNDEIKKMLVQLGCQMEGELQYDKERDENKMLTEIKNGNRFVVVNREHTLENPLPRFAYCGSWRCRIYHPQQPRNPPTCFNCQQEGHVKFQCRNPRACRVCKKTGHVEGDSECEHYKPNDALVFQGDSDPLSNFYKCNMTWKSTVVNTSEQCYVYEKASINKRADIATEVLRVSTGREAKELSKKVYTPKSWDSKNEEVMTEILREKARQVPEVLEELMASGDRKIVEAVRFQEQWSCGLSKEAASKTDPDFWPGKNRLGELWMKVRDELRNDNNDGFEIVDRKRKSSDNLNEQDVARQRKNGTTPDKVTQ